MSKKMGDVEYDEKEYLNLGANDYKENDQDLTAEIDLIDVTEEDEIYLENKQENKQNQKEEDYDEYEDDETNKGERLPKERIEDIELEAKYIAKKIKKLIEENIKYMIEKKKNLET